MIAVPAQMAARRGQGRPFALQGHPKQCALLQLRVSRILVFLTPDFLDPVRLVDRNVLIRERDRVEMVEVGW